MAFANFDSKEISAKILVAGPKGSGKTETLRSFFRQTAEEMEAGDKSFAGPPISSPFFDFLPLSAGYFRGFHLKVHFYTMASQVAFPTTAGLILRGMDGCIFLADSQVAMAAENLEVLRRTRSLFDLAGMIPSDLCWVFQYNKRDKDQVLPLEALQEQLNADRAPSVATVATADQGTVEVLQAIGRLVVQKLIHRDTPEVITGKITGGDSPTP